MLTLDLIAVAFISRSVRGKGHLQHSQRHAETTSVTKIDVFRLIVPVIGASLRQRIQLRLETHQTSQLFFLYLLSASSDVK